MAAPHSARSPQRWLAVGFALARWGMAAWFIVLGLNKAMHPVEFLKLVREYSILPSPPWLNLVAAGLPWFEVFCGLLLLTGVAVRGTALVLLGMLVPFTLLVLHRALDIQSGADIAFCAIRFDCGCGAGEVNACAKLLENSLMAMLSLALVLRREHRGSHGRAKA